MEVRLVRTLVLCLMSRVVWIRLLMFVNGLKMKRVCEVLNWMVNRLLRMSRLLDRLDRMLLCYYLLNRLRIILLKRIVSLLLMVRNLKCVWYGRMRRIRLRRIYRKSR